MDFEASLRYLHSFLNLERISLQDSRGTWNLGRMRLLLQWAGHPERSFSPLVIAGTKGKGSTGFFLAAMLEAAGISSGFYSSPHLEDPRERIRIGTRMISRKVWCRGMVRIKGLLAQHRLPRNLGDFTYFEIMTLLAVLIFQETRIRIGVFEAGMGGRLDATNALEAQIAVLTPIHLDHEAILGTTIARIAEEKAAIIRPGGVVILAPQVPEADRVVRRRASRENVAVWVPRLPFPPQPALGGDYQRLNAAVAFRAADCLEQRLGLRIPQAARRAGLKAVHWPGRLEKFPLPGRRQIILDGAHNPVSVEALARNLNAGECSCLIFGTSRDKRADTMLAILGKRFSKVVLTQAVNSRSREVAALMVFARDHFEKIFPAGDTAQAFSLALGQCPPGGTIVAAGSFYLIGELRRMLIKRGRDA